MGRPFVKDSVLKKPEKLFDVILGAKDPWRPKKQK
jgi:hypothetical protein